MTGMDRPQMYGGRARNRERPAFDPLRTSGFSPRLSPQGGTVALTAFAYIAAAIAEIAGCFAFWAWLRMGRSILWLAPGMASLALFAWLLTLVDAEHAGRAYAAYGGVYIAASLLWLWIIEGAKPDRWDLIGVAFCLGGAAIILFGPRGLPHS